MHRLFLLQAIVTVIYTRYIRNSSSPESRFPPDHPRDHLAWNLRSVHVVFTFFDRLPDQDGVRVHGIEYRGYGHS